MRVQSRMFFAILLAVILLFSARTLITSAQTETVIAIDPESSQVPIASQVQIDLSVANGLNINAFDVIIEYDADYLQLEGWVNGDMLSNLAVVKKVDDPGLFRLVCTQLATPPVSGDGTLITLIFYTEALGTTNLEITKAEFADSSGNLSLPLRQGGSITIENTPTPTRTATLTATLTSTATQTLPVTATSTSTVEGSATPAASPTSPTVLPPLLPTEPVASTSSPIMINTPGPTEVSAETPPPTVEETPTTSAGMSVTPTRDFGIVEGTSPGSARELRRYGEVNVSDVWLWVLLAIILAALGLVVAAVIRNKRGDRDHPHR